MPIRVACPDCSAVLSAPDTAAGTVVRCPKCRAPLELPSAAELARRRPADDEDERPRRPPRPRRKAKSGGGFPVWAGVLIGVLAVGAAGAGVYFLARGKGDPAGGGGGGLFGGGGGGSGVKYVPRESEKKYLALSKEKGEAPITVAEVLATMGEPTRKDPPVTGRDRRTGQVVTVEEWYWEVPGSGIASQMSIVNGFATGQIIGLETGPRQPGKD
jgi:hypothetical protein